MVGVSSRSSLIVLVCLVTRSHLSPLARYLTTHHDHIRPGTIYNSTSYIACTLAAFQPTTPLSPLGTLSLLCKPNLSLALASLSLWLPLFSVLHSPIAVCQRRTLLGFLAASLQRHHFCIHHPPTRLGYSLRWTLLVNASQHRAVVPPK